MNTVFGYPAVAAYLVSSTSGEDRPGRFSDFAAATYRACTDSRRGPDCCGMVAHSRTHRTHATIVIHPAHALGLIRARLTQLQESVPAARGAEGSENARVRSVSKHVPSAAGKWGAGKDSWEHGASPGDPAMHTMHACSVTLNAGSFRFLTSLQSQKMFANHGRSGTRPLAAHPLLPTRRTLITMRTGAHRPP